MTSKRWPDFVYSAGEEPDYRFSFANERTYLAWIRTALALMAAGVAIEVVDLPLNARSQELIGVLLIVLGLTSTIVAWVRWAWAERQLRRNRPLPSFGFGAFFTIAMVVIAVTLLASRS